MKRVFNFIKGIESERDPTRFLTASNAARSYGVKLEERANSGHSLILFFLGGLYYFLYNC